MEIIIVLLLLTVYYASQPIYDIVRIYSRSFPAMDNVISRCLNEHPYYSKLSPQGKASFVRSVRKLSLTLEFEEKMGMFLIDSRKYKICAAIVQICYGFEKRVIPKFDTIMVFPAPFFNPRYGQPMKGFASLTGKLALSWADFEMGYSDQSDNYNLGLHELAHALHINSKFDETDSHFNRHFVHWEKNSRKDFEDLQEGKNDYFREYGATNMHEFFAVCIEHFFETPQKFNAILPDLYFRTCILMNQNPLNEHGDYAFDLNDFPELKYKVRWIPT
ncbi:MAG: zinc-dependent peptidase [Flavobacteriales bacterium]|nr:zinc-dependent peptidase [Flavobacteriales bacterium]